MTVLVLSNQTETLERALLAAGHDVIVCVNRPNYGLRVKQDRPYPLRCVSHWSAFGEIADLGRELRGAIDAVATLWEGAMVAAGFLRDLLDLPGQRTDSAVAFTDKAIMKARLREAGVPVARHRVVRTASEVRRAAIDLGWPVVVKPLAGFGSTNTYVIDSPADLAAMGRKIFTQRLEASAFFAAEPAFKPLHEQGGFLVEQYVHIRREYHVDAFWADGEPLYQVPGRYNVPPLQGMGGPLGSVLLSPDTAEGSAVMRVADHAARVLGIRDGFTHAEVYFDSAGRFILGEIAARPGGGGIQPTLKHALGIDVPAILGQFGAGQTVDVEPRPQPGTYGWVGPHVPPGQIVQIANRDAILRQPGVIDATVHARVGSEGGLTGSGLWGGLAGYAFLRGDEPEQVIALMSDAADAFAIRVDELAGTAA